MSISVIIPVFNAANYIEKALNSALMQEEVSEIIIIDDGSTDGSLEFLLEFELIHKKIKVLTHEGNVNLGASASRNFGIKSSRTDLIAFLDADDFFNVNRFKKSHLFLKNNPGVDMVYENAAYYENQTNEVGSEIFFNNKMKNWSNFESYFSGINGWLILNATLFRKSAFTKIGFFDSVLRQTQDTDLILRSFLYLNCVGIRSEEPIAYLRNHSNRRAIIESKSKIYKSILYNKWYPYLLEGKVHPAFMRRFINNLLYYSEITIYNEQNRFLRKIKKLYFFLKLAIKDPIILQKLI